MYLEIQSAINFLSSFLYNKLPRRKINLFGEQLSHYLALKFQNHWYPDEPSKGSAFRCIRISATGLTDALIGAAAESVGIDLDDVLRHLPQELVIWVDPGEVTYRFGETGISNLVYSSESQGNAQVQCPTFQGNMMADSHLVAAEAPTPFVSALEILSPNDMKFTVGSFAMTRFGTTKLKSHSTIAQTAANPTAFQYAKMNSVAPPSPPSPQLSQGTSGSGSASPVPTLQQQLSFTSSKSNSATPPRLSETPSPAEKLLMVHPYWTTAT